jgi:hypothetical protein
MFFSLNKTMLALLNGLSKMKAYAIFQALRFIFMLFFLLLLVWLGAPGYYVPIIFSCAEGLLLFIMLIPARNYLDLRHCIIAQRSLPFACGVWLKSRGWKHTYWM